MVVLFYPFVRNLGKNRINHSTMETNIIMEKEKFDTWKKGKRPFSVLPLLFLLTSVFFFFTFCTYKCSNDKNVEKQEILQASSTKQDLELADDENFQENVSSGTIDKKDKIERSKTVEKSALEQSEDMVLERLSGIKVMMNLSDKKGNSGEKKLRMHPIALFLFCLPLFGMIITGTHSRKKGLLILYSAIGFLITVLAVLAAFSSPMVEHNKNSFLENIFFPFINSTAFSNIADYFDYRVLFLFAYWVFAVLFGANLKDSWRKNTGIIIAISGVLLTIFLAYLLKTNIPEEQIKNGVYLELNFGFYAIVAAFFITAMIGIMEKHRENKFTMKRVEENNFPTDKTEQTTTNN